MKKSVLTVLFALFCTMSFAQLSFNVKAGLNLQRRLISATTRTTPNSNPEYVLVSEWNISSPTSFTLQPSLFSLAGRCKVFGRIQRYRGC